MHLTKQQVTFKKKPKIVVRHVSKNGRLYKRSYKIESK